MTGPRCWQLDHCCLAGTYPTGTWWDWLFWRRCWRPTRQAFCARHNPWRTR